MITAHEEVRRLLDQIRILTNNPAILRSSDQIESICAAYMEPDQSRVGAALGLRASEGAIFELLHKRMGSTVSHDALMSISNHQADSAGSREVLAVTITRLRKKLVGTMFEGSIKPQWGVGYKMELAEPVKAC